MFRIKVRMEAAQIPWIRVPQKAGSIALAVLVLMLVVCAAFVAPHWPFSEHSITRDLQEATSASVTFGTFHTTWFPHPGCVAADVKLRNLKTGESIGTIARMRMVGTYSGLLGKRKHLLSFEVDQASIKATTNELPLKPTGESKRQIQLDRFVLRNATLEIKRDSLEKLDFTAPEIVITGLGAPRAGRFTAKINIPLPEMTVESAGTFGPIRNGDVYGTPVSGEFKVNGGNLAPFDALRGKLLANGKFSGTFGAVALDGEADSPDFELSSVHHPINVDARFLAHITIPTGEIALQSINAEMGKTKLHGNGVISPIKQDAPGFLNLDLTAPSGTVNDLLWLFSKAPEPDMIGPIRFHTIASLSRKPKHFLQEIVLRGDFVINNARFSSPATQTKLEELSKRAEGHPDDPPTYTPISLLSGDVDLHDGVANLSNVLFRVDGADANGGGTFNVEDKKIDLNGKLRMKAELSKTSKGFKAALLKLVSPFYKKHGAGADVPVSITGTTGHPKFAVHVLKK